MPLHHTGHRVFTDGFYGDDDLDFSARLALGRCAHGSADVGEVLSTLGRIGGADDWYAQWAATAQRLESAAERSAAGGHRVSAVATVLRAATAWSCAVDGLTSREDPAELLPTFRRHRACWDRFVEWSDGAHQPVAVPYEGGELQGYLLRPEASGGARPTLVMTNGSDGSITDMWSAGAAGALERGWNVFVYDGPGQQSMLFERGTHFRPDWEAVLTPVADVLLERDDVDTLAAYGISQAGYWVTRALAFEHRFAAAVVDPGVVRVADSFLAHLPHSLGKLLDDDSPKGRQQFDRQMRLGTMLPSIRAMLTFRGRPYAHDDWYDLFHQVRDYAITDDLARAVTTPLLVLSPEHEQFWPGQAEELAGMVGDRATMQRFTADEGADWHCEPMARLLVDQRMFDWLDDRLAERSSG